MGRFIATPAGTWESRRWPMCRCPQSRDGFRGRLLERRASGPRALLFRETLPETLERWLLGIAYVCHPKRIADLPQLCGGYSATLPAAAQPSRPGTSLSRPDTFAGVACGISPERVVAAARLGFFPLIHCGPLKWWTRTERMVLPLGAQRITKNLKRLMRKNAYRVTFDTAFDEVIKACAGRRKGRRSRSPGSRRRSCSSTPTCTPWGMRTPSRCGARTVSSSAVATVSAVGRIFFTKLQFGRESNTSRWTSSALNHHLARWGYVLNDGKDYAGAVDSGFRADSARRVRGPAWRARARRRLGGAMHVEADLATVAG